MATVLIVEDSPTTQMLLKKILEMGGHLVVGLAGNGLDGLRLVDELAPDLVLMDMLMPKMDGLEVLRELRAKHPVLPVVLLTSVNTPEKIKAARMAGASHYLLKPFEADKVLEVTHKCLAQAQA